MPRTFVMLTFVVGGVVAALVGTVACSAGPSFDRERAVAAVVDQGNGRISRSQAECYVDRVVDQLGPGPLQPGAEPTPEQVPRITGIRIDCIGVTNIGTVPLATVPPELDAEGTAPRRHGDDARLDVLYDACQAGDGGACDELFDAAPIGSDYEAFASTCGGRTPELRCVDRYPSTSTSTSVGSASTAPSPP